MNDPADLTIYSTGLCYGSVCTALDDDETTRQLNAQRPTGVGPWTIDTAGTFADGTPNPQPCHNHPATHRHVLFSC